MAIGEGATVLAHSFKDGRLHFDQACCAAWRCMLSTQGAAAAACISCPTASSQWRDKALKVLSRLLLTLSRVHR